MRGVPFETVYCGVRRGRNPSNMLRAMPIVLAVLLIPSADASAQRRDGGGDLATLEITLKRATKFADTTVAPGSYRVSLGNGILTLTQSRSMVAAARMPVEESTLEQAVDEASAEVKRKRKAVEIRVRYRDRAYVARGTEVEREVPRGPSVDLASRKSALGITGGIPDAKTDLELIAQSLTRYEKDVKHCADQAHKQRWTTDHPRFRRCVCPLTKKWRMPKVEKATRVHRILAKRRSGYSITVTDGGKVADCRVWTGSKPPADEKTTAAVATP